MAVLRPMFRRDFEIEKSYQLSMMLQFVDVVVLAVGLYFISRLVGKPASLADFNGTYFDYAIIGIAVNSFARVGLRGFTTSIVREQSTGTIDLLLASPVPPAYFVSGMFLFPLTLALGEVAGLLGVGIGVIGSGIPLGGLAMSVPFMLLTTATFAAVGIASAGVLLLTKRGDPISGAYYQLSMLLSGALFPISELPGFLRKLSVLLPATWGIRAVRKLLLSGAGWHDVAGDALVLCLFTVVMLPLGLLVFRRCLTSARRQGIVGSY